MTDRDVSQAGWRGNVQPGDVRSVVLHSLSILLFGGLVLFEIYNFGGLPSVLLIGFFALFVAVDVSVVRETITFWQNPEARVAHQAEMAALREEREARNRERSPIDRMKWFRWHGAFMIVSGLGFLFYARGFRSSEEVLALEEAMLSVGRPAAILSALVGVAMVAVLTYLIERDRRSGQQGPDQPTLL